MKVPWSKRIPWNQFLLLFAIAAVLTVAANQILGEPWATVANVAFAVGFVIAYRICQLQFWRNEPGARV